MRRREFVAASAALAVTALLVPQPVLPAANRLRELKLAIPSLVVAGRRFAVTKRTVHLQDQRILFHFVVKMTSDEAEDLWDAVPRGRHEVTCPILGTFEVTGMVTAQIDEQRRAVWFWVAA